MLQDCFVASLFSRRLRQHSNLQVPPPARLAKTHLQIQRMIETRRLGTSEVRSREFARSLGATAIGPQPSPRWRKALEYLCQGKPFSSSEPWKPLRAA